MKKFWLGLALVMVLGQAALVWAQPKPVLRLVGDNWCPYNCDPAQGRSGYLIDLLHTLLEDRYRLDYELLPWTRAVKAVELGQRDVLVAASPTNSRLLLYSLPLGVDRTCFFVQTGSDWQYRLISDLAQFRIGVVQDYKYDNDGPLDALIERYRTTHDSRLELAAGDDALRSNFRKLAAGRTGVVLENDIVGAYTLQSMGLTQAIKQAGCLKDAPGTVHVAVSAKRPDAALLLKRIDAGVQALRQRQALQTLLQPYGMTDWQPLLVGGH